MHVTNGRPLNTYILNFISIGKKEIIHVINLIVCSFFEYWSAISFDCYITLAPLLLGY